MEKWFVTTKKADFNAISKEFGIDPVLARIIRNRDIIEREDINMFLNGTLADLHNPRLMKDMEKGCEVILEKISQGKKIRVIGDYDIDGVCATHILKKGLEIAGADVDTVVPHRINDGYGLNSTLIKDAHEEGIDTLITCDNGISAYEQIVYANELGMTVVVTDHHEVPYMEEHGKRKEVLPPAAAVIDPKQEECKYPFSGICGAVVAYKFVDVLLEASDAVSQEKRQEFLKEELCFAAIATIGDVMDLLDENHIIVKYGLEAIHESNNVGLHALLAANDLEHVSLSPYHIGFVIGPCINATGRLDTATRALELFDTDNERIAVKLAVELKQLNENRKVLTAKGLEEAIEKVESRPLPSVLVIYLPDCHESIAGIIAGKIKERYNRPTIILTKAEEGVKGSGRSIEAYSMYDKLHEVEELFTKYGGHPMAAGLSMASESDVHLLRERLNKKAKLKDSDFINKVYIDVAMPISYLAFSLIEQLERLAPYGNGNPKPLFAQKNVKLYQGSIFGKNRNVAKFTCDDGSGKRVEAVYFGEADEMLAQVEAHDGICSIVYYPEINEYRGRKSIQIVVKYYDFNSKS